MQSPVKLWRNQKKIQNLVGKTGVVISWTKVRVPLAGFANQAPYPVVIVELTDGKRITAQLVDYDDADIRTGLVVRTVVRRVMEPDTDGIIPYGIKVRPVG